MWTFSETHTQAQKNQSASQVSKGANSCPLCQQRWNHYVNAKSKDKCH